jgi:MOSC domain-containing protein YiiM
MTGVIEQLSISKGGVPKYPMPRAWAGPLGLEGDAQRHTGIHGGPLQALLLVSKEDIEALREQGFPVAPGSLGENLTISGIDFRQLRPGMRLRAGDAVIELTKIRRPCDQLEIYNGGGKGRIQKAVHSVAARGGFYAAVVQAGAIRPGDAIALIDAAV